MAFRDILPLTQLEHAFCEIYQKHRTTLHYMPDHANLNEFLSLRNAMLPEVDRLMAAQGHLWHRMPAFAPDELYETLPGSFRYVPDLCYVRFFPMPQHANESYELVLCVEGKNRYYINAQPIDLAAGDVLILAPYTPQAAGIFESDCIRRNIVLRRSAVQDRYTMLTSARGSISDFFRRTYDGSIHQAYCLVHCSASLRSNPLMNLLYSRSPGKTPAEIVYEDSLLTAFLAQLQIAHADRIVTHIQTMDSAEDQVMNHLRHEFLHLSQTDLANRFSYSTRQILRIVQRHTGMSYQSYVSKLRMEYIADLLINSEFPVIQIIESAGYKNNQSFYQQFRQRFGLSPLQYREKNQ